MLTLVPVNNSLTPTRSLLQPSRRGLHQQLAMCVKPRSSFYLEVFGLATLVYHRVEVVH